jgi:hypothetical protein
MPKDPEDFRVPRPWVQIAAFCQTALQEATGALSIIRVLDRLGLAGMTPEMQPQPLQLTMVLVLKSDQMNGQYRANIRCTSPLGNVTTGPDMPFLFEGEDRGVQLVLPAGVLATEPGLYWFDVLIENEIITRVPLRVLYQRIQMPPGMGQPGGMGTPPGAPSQ